MGFEPTTSAVTGRRANQLRHRTSMQNILDLSLKKSKLPVQPIKSSVNYLDAKDVGAFFDKTRKDICNSRA